MAGKSRAKGIQRSISRTRRLRDTRREARSKVALLGVRSSFATPLRGFAAKLVDYSMTIDPSRFLITASAPFIISSMMLAALISRLV